MFRWCLVYLVSILGAIRIVSHNYILRVDLAIDTSYSILVKNTKIILQICQKKTWLRAVETLSGPSSICLKACYVF